MLRVPDNFLGDKDVCALAAVLPQTQLKQLDFTSTFARCLPVGRRVLLDRRVA